MISREDILFKFGSATADNINMIHAIITDLDPDSIITISDAPHDHIIIMSILFPENTSPSLDTHKLAELRATVIGFDTHLVEIILDCDKNTLVYEMLNQSKVPASMAKKRSVFHRVGSNADPLRIDSYMTPACIVSLKDTLPQQQYEMVKQAVETYTLLEETATTFDVSICESHGIICELALSGIRKIRATTCILMTRNALLRCTCVTAKNSTIRLTIDYEQRTGPAPRPGWLRRMTRRLSNLLVY
jgi:hypothetical protein